MPYSHQSRMFMKEFVHNGSSKQPKLTGFFKLKADTEDPVSTAEAPLLQTDATTAVTDDVTRTPASALHLPALPCTLRENDLTTGAVGPEVVDLADGCDAPPNPPLNIPLACQGYAPKLPGPFQLWYPHNLNLLSVRVPWKVIDERLHHTMCDGVAVVGGPRCTHCASIEKESLLKTIEEKAENVSIGLVDQTKDYYLGYAAIQKKKNIFAELNRKDFFEVSRLNRIVGKHTKTAAIYSKIMNVLATKDVVRIQTLFSALLEAGSSPAAILAQVQKAGEGLRARLPDPRASGESEKLFDMMALVASMGNRKLGDVLSKAIGLPSYSHWKKTSGPTLPHLRTTSSLSSIEPDLLHNIVEVLKSHDKTKSLWILTCDETAIDERIVADFHGHNGEKCLVGFCVQCLGNICTKVTTYDRLETLSSFLHDSDNKSVHLASQALVYSIIPLRSSHYCARPVLILPICKEKNNSLATKVVNAFVGIWEKEYEREYGSLISVYTDYDGSRIKQLQALFRSTSMRPSHPLYAWVTSMPLFDGHFDKYLFAADTKHALKNLARVFRREAGFKVGSFTITPVLLDSILQLGGINETQRSAFADKERGQDVKLSKSYVDTVCEVSGRLLRETDTVFTDANRFSDLLLFATIGQKFYASCMNFKADIFSILRDLSCAAHLILVLYREHTTSFIPAQLYNAMQLTVHDIFVLVKKAQETEYMSDLFLFQVGTDLLELSFCIIRTLTHNRNVDALSIASKFSQSQIIAAISQKYPEWKIGGKKLNSVNDHVNTATWSGSTSLDVFNTEEAWRIGGMDATTLLSEHYYFQAQPALYDFATMALDGITTLRPLDRSKTVGVTNVDINPYGDSSAELASDNTTVPILESELDLLLDSIPDGGGVHDINNDENLLYLPDGTSVHVVSAVRHFMGLGHSKSSDRMRRIRGYGKTFKSSFHVRGDDDDDASPETDIQLQDVLVVVTSDKSRSMASLRLLVVTKLQQGGENVLSIPHQSLPNVDVTVYGQWAALEIEEWKHLSAPPGATSMLEGDNIVDSRITETAPLRDSDTLYATWNGNVVSTTKLHKVDGNHAWPLMMQLDCTMKKWIVPLDNLHDILEHVFDESKLKLFPVSDFSKDFPSRYLDTVLVRIESPIAAEARHHRCPFCGINKEHDRGNFRKHLAHHLLGLLPASACDVLNKVYCGFCGGNCSVTVQHSKKNPSADDIHYPKEYFGLPVPKNKKHNFRIETVCRVSTLKSVTTQFKSLAKFSFTNPSTNAPIRCPVEGCSQCVFKYSLAAHVQQQHRETTLAAVLQSIMTFVINLKENAISDEEIERQTALLSQTYDTATTTHPITMVFRRLIREKVWFNDGLLQNTIVSRVSRAAHVTEDAVAATDAVTDDAVAATDAVTDDAVAATDAVTDDAVAATDAVTEDE